jgi:hypothetical protein
MSRTRVAPPKIEVLPPESDRPAVDPLLVELSQWMDTKFRIPGVNLRFGLDALLGLIPGLGDAVTFLVSCYILSTAANLGVPRITIARMGTNVLVDLVMGCVPVLGDLFDVAWKANTRNVELLRRTLEATPQSQRRARRGDWLFVIGMLAALFVLMALLVALAWMVLGSLYTGISSGLQG